MNGEAERWLRVLADHQVVELRDGARVLRTYPVSTALNGLGEQDGSFCTPRGWHRIAARIGDGCPVGAVFRGRQWTGEICTPANHAAEPERDWILTRILWLEGLEAGHNRGGTVDTRQRYIYFHGTPDAVGFGEPGSRGCIRMRNTDILALFDAVAEGTPVWIGATAEAPATSAAAFTRPGDAS